MGALNLTARYTGKEATRPIGNSVRPLFMKAIADRIRRSTLPEDMASTGLTAT